MAEAAAGLKIEIVHAGPQQVTVKSYRLAQPATVADALRLAAADPEFTALDPANCTVGVFGRLARPEQLLKAGDRLEIYRGPAVDAKRARRGRLAGARRA
jgi:putative ubiquitin-RnfH superfamily antitoxin RatB of RatAB toxin-antitoxin module